MGSMVLVKFVIVNVFIHFFEFSYFVIWYAASSRIHVLVLYNGEWKQTRENMVECFVLKQAKSRYVKRYLLQ